MNHELNSVIDNIEYEITSETTCEVVKFEGELTIESAYKVKWNSWHEYGALLKDGEWV